MGVYIKDMTLEEFSEYGDYCQTLIGTGQAEEVPPHGRLGDLDKLESGLRLMAKYQDGERQQGILGCCETIRLARTIIPADPVEEGET